MAHDAILYLVTQPYLSAKRLRALSEGLVAASTLPSAIARMEGAGIGPTAALDALVAGGHRCILVQPVGLPFSDSLAAWLPGALAHWLAGQEGITLALAADQVADNAVLAAVAQQTMAKADKARPVDPAKAALDNPGWQDPPPFKHHVLVCSGPRCTFREAGSVKSALVEALKAAGVYDDCLIALTGCLYPCNQGPIVAVYPAGHWYRLEASDDVTQFAQGLAQGTPVPQLIIHEVKS